MPFISCAFAAIGVSVVATHRPRASERIASDGLPKARKILQPDMGALDGLAGNRNPFMTVTGKMLMLCMQLRLITLARQFTARARAVLHHARRRSESFYDHE